VWRPIIGLAFGSVPDGDQVLFLGTGGESGEVNQSLGVSLTPDTRYTLTYFVGSSSAVSISEYSAALLVGSTVLNAESGGRPAPGSFVERTLTFTTGDVPAAGTLNIDIFATGSHVQPAQVQFDMFSLTAAPAPEPASILLLAGSLLGGSVIARKRLFDRH
jgi:hypothetical protein